MGVEPERGAHSTLQEGRHAAVDDRAASGAPACSSRGAEEREAVVAVH